MLGGIPIKRQHSTILIVFFILFSMLSMLTNHTSLPLTDHIHRSPVSQKETFLPTLASEQMLTNNPPNKPSNPSPANASKNISLQPMLQILVVDPDNDNMTVSFYNASNHHLIGVVTNVSNATYASVNWTNLAYNTTYYWNVVVNDSSQQNTSETYTFTTIERLPLTIIFNNGKGLRATIKNNGKYDLTNIQWNLSITGKRKNIAGMINISNTGIINLNAHGDTILTMFPKGVGRIQITITLFANDQTITASVDGILLRYRILVW